MRLGLLDMIGLAGSLVFALPLANYAVIRLFAGEVALGVGLFVVAAAMVVLPQYFLDPARIARRLFSGLLPRQLRGDTDSADAGRESGADESESPDAAAVDGDDATGR
ncbi:MULTISPECIES: DUF7533 family protein [Halorubrum]|uniref:Uncharacterized protein n=1 Tax=Halorubrum sodomense TaxID=35743 RepID=A0A1I6FUL6_HALSD|nr:MULTISPECIES: hypothetical protein [Halorubrum]TKX53649.1 hypothetical protein EXE42_11950 [Halorubrum sp. SP3]TKX69538.1 hypothetical protein EXE45_07860 [Halorubrum sp. SP9]SFR33507.1 hypothetical protein SAMN04487937_1211 [Halorubrum sodomense]